jgi:hypothetical protein
MLSVVKKVVELVIKYFFHRIVCFLGCEESGDFSFIATLVLLLSTQINRQMPKKIGNFLIS